MIVSIFLFFTATPSVAWSLLVPTPMVVRSSSSPYSTTTCLLKCIMSLPVEMTAARNVIYYVNTTMNYVS